jgi:HSP20 family protein
MTVTTMVRWSPFQELEQLERRMRRMFEAPGMVGSQFPAADLYESDAEYVLELEVPGFDEKELKIDVTDHTLTIKGERKEEKEEKGKTFFLHERLEKSFERRFAMPDEANTEKIAATFSSGVLKVAAPKSPAEPKRTIEISAN